MLYILVIVVFFFSIILLLLSKNGFINREMQMYDNSIRQPWLNRTVLLVADDSLFKN